MVDEEITGGGEMWRKRQKDGKASKSQTISVTQHSKRTASNLFTWRNCISLRSRKDKNKEKT